ncbi:MAG: S8 family peptidase [Methylocystaceae bacterium]
MLKMISNQGVKRVFNKTLAADPWFPPGVAVIGAHREWKSTRGKNIVVGVIDTGIDYRHPDLQNQILDGKNFVPDGNDYYDLNGHGTHVAGIIAANGRLLGVAPEAKLLIARALNANGQGDAASIASALDWIGSWRGPNGEQASVVNMSLGMPVDDTRLHQTVIQVANSGVTMVAAAGNEGDDNPATLEISYPAYWLEVLSVGAVNLALKAANFTNANDRIAVVAPGVDTFSTYPGGKYVQLSGTSMASPHIAGAAALIQSHHLRNFGSIPNPEWTYKYLKLNTIDLGNIGYDDLYGYGLFSFNPSGGIYLRLSANSKKFYSNEQSGNLTHPFISIKGVPYLSLPDLKQQLYIDYAWFANRGELEIWD